MSSAISGAYNFILTNQTVLVIEPRGVELLLVRPAVNAALPNPGEASHVS